MQAGRRTLYALLCALMLTGCRSTEPLENELRARDFQYRELLDELGRVEGRNDSLHRELAHVRQTGPKIVGEEAARLHGLKRIVLGKLTGGYDNDGLPGDEALQVVLETRDADDRPAKITGALRVTALEVNFRGQKTPLCTWDVTPEQLQRTWKQGLVSVGYHLILPWKKLPTKELVRIEARFTLAPEVVYEADKDVKVRLIPGIRANPTTTVPPEIIPSPAPPPLPFSAPPNAGPALVPTGNWQPAPLGQSILLGRPEPIVPMTVPVLP